MFATPIKTSRTSPYIVVVDTDPENAGFLTLAFQTFGNTTTNKEYQNGKDLFQTIDAGIPLPCPLVIDLNTLEFKGVDLILLFKANASVCHILTSV